MTASAGFKIPFARDSREKLVTPGEARRGEPHTCPACNAIVDLHAGEIKRRHFHHRKAACSAETVVHLTAKLLIVRAVQEWRRGGKAVTFRRRCEEPGCDTETFMQLPRKVRRAEDEWRLRSGRIVDVALLGAGDLPIAAIEVCVTHDVPDDKTLDLSLPWIEVDGEAVCASAGRVLVPIRDHFLPWLCSDHSHRRGMARREKLDADRLKNRLLRDLGYAIADYPGYRIGAVTRCPNGHDTLVIAWTGKHPPWPRPPHVVTFEPEHEVIFDRTKARARKVLPFRRRWSSVCTACGAKVEA